jgi:hypothetical protein
MVAPVESLSQPNPTLDALLTLFGMTVIVAVICLFSR